MIAVCRLAILNVMSVTSFIAFLLVAKCQLSAHTYMCVPCTRCEFSHFCYGESYRKVIFASPMSFSMRFILNTYVKINVCAVIEKDGTGQRLMKTCVCHTFR